MIDIERLASNPNAMTLERLRDILQSTPDANAEVRRVMPADVAEAVLACCATPSATGRSGEAVLDEAVSTGAPKGVKDCPPEDFNMVCFWGRKGSGKTTVVSALISAVEDVTLCPGSQTSRHKAMRRLFCPISEGSAYSLMPTDESTALVQTTHCIVEHGEGLQKKRFPLLLVEVDRDADGIYPIYNGLLTRECVHIFCMDCSDDVREQAREFLRLIDRLDESGYLDESSGLYILVTKTDSMLRVPREYRDKAAQTLITAGQRELWLKVINICYRRGINDPTPIAFSVGDTSLCRVFRRDAGPARRLMERPILLKSQSALNRAERVLRKGNKWTTGAVFLVLLIGALYGLYKAFSPDMPYPDAPIRPVSISEYVDRRIAEDIADQPFRRARKAYDDVKGTLGRHHRIEVRRDPEVCRREDSLRREHGFELLEAQRDDHLISDSCHKANLRKLQESFAPVLNQQLAELFSQRNWDAEFATRPTYLELCNRRYKEYIETYRNIIEPAYTLSGKCRSREDVDEVMAVYNRYVATRPYSRLDKVERLKERAEQSYEDHKRNNPIESAIEWLFGSE